MRVFTASALVLDDTGQKEDKSRDMSAEMRLCFPFNFPAYLEFNGGKFHGYFAGPVNELIDYLRHRSNFTFAVQDRNDGVGEMNPSTGRFDGCIDRLQRNESDGMFQLVNYPLNATGVQQGDIAHDSFPQVISLYFSRSANAKEEVKIESCFKSFSATVWSMCVLTVLLVYLLVAIRRRIYNRVYYERKYLSNLIQRGLFFRRKILLDARKREAGVRRLMKTNPRTRNRFYFTQILSHMTGFRSLRNPEGVFKKLAFIICSIFSLLVIHYFRSNIKTELVTIKPPELFTSYQELIDNKVAISFLKGFNDYLQFKFAPTGSKEKKLWDFSVRKYSEGKIMIEQRKVDGIMEIFSRIFSRKMVLIVGSYMQFLVMKESCTYFCESSSFKQISSAFQLPQSDLGGVFPIPMRKAGVKTSLKGLIYSSQFKGPVQKHITRRLKRFAEVGLVVYSFKSYEKSNIVSNLVLGSVKKKEGTFNKIEKCAQGTIMKPEFVLAAIKLHNMSDFIVLIMFFLSVAATALIFEVFKFKRCKVKNGFI